MPLPTAAILREPTVSVLSRPSFTEPAHLAVNWVGDATDGERLAEYAGRLGYMSQENPARRETREFLQNIVVQGHGGVLEHANYSLLIEGISRSLAHELIHQNSDFAYSQLSERHRENAERTFVMPPALIGDTDLEAAWLSELEHAVRAYDALIEGVLGRYAWMDDRAKRRRLAREAAASVLPSCAEVKLIVTGNMRDWRKLLQSHAGDDAELEFRRLAVTIFRLLQQEGPAFFSDIEIFSAGDRREALRTLYQKP